MKGMIDNVFDKNVYDLSQTFEDNFCEKKFIGVFEIGEMEVQDFAFHPQLEEKSKLMTMTASKRRCENLTYIERLVIIIVSSTCLFRTFH